MKYLGGPHRFYDLTPEEQRDALAWLATAPKGPRRKQGTITDPELAAFVRQAGGG